MINFKCLHLPDLKARGSGPVVYQSHPNAKLNEHALAATGFVNRFLSKRHGFPGASAEGLLELKRRRAALGLATKRLIPTGYARPSRFGDRSTSQTQQRIASCWLLVDQ